MLIEETIDEDPNLESIISKKKRICYRLKETWICFKLTPWCQITFIRKIIQKRNHG